MGSKTHKCLYLWGGDLLHLQSIVQQLSGREMLFHKVFEDLYPHVRIIDLKMLINQ